LYRDLRERRDIFDSLLAHTFSLVGIGLVVRSVIPSSKPTCLFSCPLFKCANTSRSRDKWRINRTFLLVPAHQTVGQFIATFKEYPPSQKVGSFSLDQVLEKLSQSGSSGK
jgi:hypothetical protein